MNDARQTPRRTAPKQASRPDKAAASLPAAHEGQHEAAMPGHDHSPTVPRPDDAYGVPLADALERFTDPALTERIRTDRAAWEAAGRPSPGSAIVLHDVINGSYGSGIPTLRELNEAYARRCADLLTRLRAGELEADWTDDPVTAPWRPFQAGAWEYLTIVHFGSEPVVYRRGGDWWPWVRVRAASAASEAPGPPGEPPAPRNRPQAYKRALFDAEFTRVHGDATVRDGKSVRTHMVQWSKALKTSEGQLPSKGWVDKQLKRLKHRAT